MLSCMLNGNRINICDYNKDELKKWANKKILLCPACGKPYEVCYGKVVSPYFRHMDKQECLALYSEPETEEHKNGKRALYEWIRKQDGVTDCVLEGWISFTKQRPDIMFEYNNQLCVLEYQCTPIATEYYERHELYQAAGINDIWICGTEKYLASNMRIKEIEKQSGIYFNSTDKIFIFDKYKAWLYPKQNKYNLDEVEFNSESKICIKQYFKDSCKLDDIKSKYYKEYTNQLMNIIVNNFSEFSIDSYESNVVNYKYNTICFEIDVPNSRFIYFRKYFTKDKFTHRWTCNISKKSSKTFDTLDVTSFILYVKYFYPEAKF